MEFLKPEDLGPGASGSYAAPTSPRSKIQASSKLFLDKLQIYPEKIKKITLGILENINDLELPKPGEQFRIRTQTQLNLISTVLKIVADHKFIEELTVTTYTLNKEAFDIFKQLVKSKRVEKLNLFVSSAYLFRDPTHSTALKKGCLELSKKYPITLCFAWSHFKITLAKCGDNFYQSESSMNFSMNNMAEQILICNDKAIYDFDYEFVMKTCRASNHKALEIIC